MDDEKMVLLIDGRVGIHLPERFVHNYDPVAWGLDQNSTEVQTLKAGADAENYWECWDDVLKKAKCTAPSGHCWTLWQNDGDLFAVRDDFDVSSLPE